MRIGIDFDNTLVCYDRLFQRLASERQLLPEPPADKRQLRDRLRLQPNGELHWQQLQALAYGERITEAALFPGALETLRRLRQRGDELFVVSHKSRFAAQDPGGADLHQAAVGFLRQHGLLTGLLCREQIFFEPQRAAKVARIAQLGCDLFLDDLPETFAEPGFPGGTRKILFADEGPAELERCSDWSAVARLLGIV